MNSLPLDRGSVEMRYPQRNLAACMLPWTADFQLDVPVFEKHIQDTLDGGYQSLYLMGTAGEGYAMSDARFRQVVEVFAGMTVREGLDPQVGVISLSMEQVIERIGFAHEQGIRMFQISLPSWGVLDDQETMTFFKTVCGSYPDCRFLHYNLPRTGRILTGKDYRRIVDEVPNLVATKNSSYDFNRTADLIREAPELQHFLLEGNYFMGCALGECSLLCSFGTLFPKLTWQYFEAGLRRDLEELFCIAEFLRTVVPRLFGHCQRKLIDGAYDKTFIWLRHPEFSHRLLPPYQGLTVQEAGQCREVFEREFAEIL